MAPAEDVATISVLMVWSPGPRRVEQAWLTLPSGCHVGQALAHALQQGVASAVLPLPADMATAIWGRRVPAGEVLRKGDRLELCRPLQVDPKHARRVRYRAQGEKLPKGIHRSSKSAPPDMTQSPGKPAKG